MKLLILMLTVCFSATVNAQSKAEKLYAEGEQLAATATVASQEAAIKKFKAAKVVFTNAKKKQICDRAVAACRKNIKTINERNAAKKTTASAKKKPSKAHNDTPKHEEETSQQEIIVIEKPVIIEQRAVALAARPGSLLFKGNTKGKPQTIHVTCNFDDWYVVSQPHWIASAISIDHQQLIVNAYDNDNNFPRTGEIKIQCGNKIATIIVEQKKGKKRK